MPARPFGVITYTVKPQDTLWLIAQKFGTSIAAIISLNPGVNPRYLTVGQSIYVRPCRCGPRSNHSDPDSNISKSDLSNTIRMLWEQHVYWTRMTIISMIENLPDVNAVTDRLLRNAADFETALKPFYGSEIARKFGELLRNHLTIAAQLVAAAKAGDQNAAADAERRWYENAALIATFLGSINPHWSAEMWKSMLNEHLALTKSEAVAILTKNYPESIRLFDEIERQALKMADVMVEGLAK